MCPRTMSRGTKTGASARKEVLQLVERTELENTGSRNTLCRYKSHGQVAVRQYGSTVRFAPPLTMNGIGHRSLTPGTAENSDVQNL